MYMVLLCAKSFGHTLYTVQIHMYTGNTRFTNYYSEHPKLYAIYI